MKTIDGYICDLLYSNDCIILQEFGGFVASYTPSRMHPTHRMLHPPSKRILFNVRLQTNDGLLANYIAEMEKISYQESMFRIQQFTTQCLNALKENKSVVFAQIGTFSFNKEGKLEFIPFQETNFLEEAYGLTSLVAPPPAGKKARTVKRPAPEKRSAVKSNNTKILPRVVFTSILLAVIASWGYYHSPLFKDIYTHYSGIVPLIRASHQQPPVFSDTPVEQKSTVDLTTAASPPEIIESGDEPEIVPPAVTPAVTPIDTPAVTPVVTPSVSTVATKQFYIIAGAFKDEINASSLETRLKNKGYDARRAGRTKGGLYRVCYGVYADKKQALRALDTIRQNEDPQAWLMVE
ncbi:MAG TPA: SPOR domain-containing protein [Bacteroidales bacterium]|nr:SPOR domain-containing protein [Bacteroidales bacterium]HNS46824.1 SPOR domain-containing protein [Bacteroidales bacterium]